MFLKFTNLFDAPDTDKPAIVPSSDDKDAVIKFLGDDDDEKTEPIILDDKKEVKEEKEKEEEEAEEEVDELKEIEEDLDEPDEEKLELTAPVSRREILKAYPDLFKKFPHLENALYRNYQFTEMFPTMDDAKEAMGKAETLDNVEKDITDGNIERILMATKEGKSFNKLIDNYLPLLAKVDEKAYNHVIGNVVKHTIVSMVNESKRSGNESLQAAAQILNQYVFGSSDFEAPKRLATDESKPDNREVELNKQREDFFKQRLTAVSDELDTKVNNSLRATIDANIDPKESMSDYVKKTASRDAMETLEELIENDKRFHILTDRLWEKAARNNFAKADVDKIRSAYFAKAKTLLPSVIKKARNEALKGIGKRVVEKDGDDRAEKQERSKSKEEKSGKIPGKMSTLEYLMQD